MKIGQLVYPGDLHRVEQFYKASPGFWLLAEGKLPGRPQAEEFFKEHPKNQKPEDGLRWGMFDGAELIGLANFYFNHPQTGDAFIGMFMVGENTRRQGRGRFFVQAIEDEARAQALTNVQLCVFDTNEAGSAFWSAQGFVDTGKRVEIERGMRRLRLHYLRKEL